MDGPRGPGGVSRVSGARDEVRSLSSKRRWIPPSSVRRDAISQENRNDSTFRKVQGILNKLTPEKFEKLSDDILAIDLNSDQILKGVILLIFKKALDEPKYSSMYAQLCKRLSEEAPNLEPPEEESNTFKKLLLANCRKQFETRYQASEEFEQNEGPLSPDDEDRQLVAKRKMLGNIKFIGELGKLEILSEAILHRCIQSLLQNTSRTRTAKIKDVSEDVECLAQIMRTCGRILDTEKGQQLMDQYFDRMKVLAENQDFPIRIRFMLKDVIELRRDKWVPRKATSTEGPMPINQIRNDDKLRSFVTNNSMTRPNPNAGLVGFFGTQMKTRGGFDDLLNVGNFNPNPPFLPPPDNYNKGYVNGFQSGTFRGNSRNNPGGNYNRHYNNNYNNNKQNAQQHYNNNNSASKLPPRFQKNHTQVGMPGVIEDISLRPTAFKTPTPKPVTPLTSGRINPLLSEPLLSAAPQIQMTKEPPILIKQASAEKGKSAKKDKGPSKEETLKKLTVILNEHLSADTLSESVTAIKELKAPERYLPSMVLHILNHTIDNNADSERNLSVSLIVELKKEGIVTSDKFLEALRDLTSSMSEKEPQIPRIHSYVAGYIKQAILSELTALAAVADITDGGAYYPLFMLVLQALYKSEGKQKLTQLFNESKVNLLNQVAESDRTKERLSEILSERDLSFLYPLSTIQSSLWKQLQADPNPTQFYKWVKENLDPSHYTNPGFINALVTVILKYITQESTLAEGSDPNAVPEKQLTEKEKSLLEKYKPVLQAFLHERQELQVIAVYSLQVLCYSLQFPKGMLLRWFMHLYDSEIVEEEAFMKWKEDLTDAYPGKGKALFQVNQWLTWLAEAESEEEEEEDDNDT